MVWLTSLWNVNVEQSSVYEGIACWFICFINQLIGQIAPFSFSAINQCLFGFVGANELIRIGFQTLVVSLFFGVAVPLWYFYFRQQPNFICKLYLNANVRTQDTSTDIQSSYDNTITWGNSRDKTLREIYSAPAHARVCNPIPLTDKGDNKELKARERINESFLNIFYYHIFFF